MSAIRALERMLAAGVPLETAMELAKQFEADVTEYVATLAREMAHAPQATAEDKRQARNRRYYESKQRLKASENKTNKTVSDGSDASKTVSDAALTCAQVVIPSSSLRSEEEDTPKNPSGSAPKGAARSKKRDRRSRFVPEDWNPTEADMAYAAQLGFSPGEIERELAKFRRYEFARPYSHWSRTFHGWLDRAAERKPRQAHERPNPDSKFLARHANYAAAAEGARRVVEASRRSHSDGPATDPFWEDFGS